ncbi:MAG: glycosyltransferase [Candidatus Aminicenantales bacterium]
MWEETFDELEIEGRSRGFVFNLPFLKARIDQIIVFFILIGCTLIVIVAVKFHLFRDWAGFLGSTKFLRIAAYPLIVSAAGIVATLVLQTVLWLRYRPETLGGDEEDAAWPSVSVIVAALDEEASVGKAIDSIFASNYPQDKLEVICVNDGSTDLTYHHMLRAELTYGTRLKVVSFKRNLGKRKALYVGYKKAKGDVIVTIDADGAIGRAALRNVVVPLMNDGRVGAVSGRVAALNERDNFLTRMLAVRYSVSFDFGRAYQSVFGTVVCCPGALTAMRKDLLEKIIYEFMHQKFLNQPCTHGEDRALTTLILRSGYDVKYQSNAVVYTNVPRGFKQMNRMYVRWTRSYLRESVFLGRFIFSREKKRHRVLPIIDFVFLNFLHPFHLFSLGLIVYAFAVNPLFMLRHLTLLPIASLMLSLYYLRTNKSLSFLYGIPYGFIAVFFLWWIVPFSALTMKDQSWVTR